jgi:hypothetical protein
MLNFDSLLFIVLKFFMMGLFISVADLYGSQLFPCKGHGGDFFSGTMGKSEEGPSVNTWEV